MKVFILAVLFLFNIMTAEVFSLIEQDTFDLSFSQYKDINFQVTEEMSQDALLRGNVQIFPRTASIELILFHEDDYRRWKGTGEDVDTLTYMYITSEPFEIEPPGVGDYILIVSNKSDYLPVAVIINLDHHFTRTDPEELLPAAFKFTHLIIILVAISFSIGTFIIKHFSRS